MVSTREAKLPTARISIWMAAVAVAGLLSCAVWSAETLPATNAKLLADSGKKPTPKAPIPVDRETEELALELVRVHLPELDVVLERLRADQSREYDRAIRDLAKSARKLELAKNRDEQLYDLEVELLKAQNQVNLLTAKLKVRDSQSDRDRLRSSAARLQQAQIACAQYDLEQFRERYERAKQQLDAAQERVEAKQSNADEQLEKSYLGMLRKAGREAKK